MAEIIEKGIIKMNKAFKIVLMVCAIVLVLSIFSFTACTAPVDQDMKKRLIEYEEQSYAILYESPQAKEGFSLRAEVEQIYSTTTEFSIQEVEEVEAIMKKLNKDYEYMLSGLGTLPPLLGL